MKTSHFNSSCDIQDKRIAFLFPLPFPRSAQLSWRLNGARVRSVGRSVGPFLIMTLRKVHFEEEDDEAAVVMWVTLKSLQRTKLQHPHQINLHPDLHTSDLVKTD